MQRVILLSILIFSITCSKQEQESIQTEPMEEPSIESRAQELAQKLIITDGHIDLPYRLHDLMEDVSKQTDHGEFDLVRARAGGLNAPFMSIYVPSSYQENGGAKEFAEQMIALVTQITREHPDKFAIATNPDEVEQLFEKKMIAFPMGMENGAPLEDDLDNVQYFHQKGIRYITLTHAKDNLICDSSYDTTRTWNGLSDYGKAVVKEMNRVGVMIDVSHVSDQAFYQVIEITEAPVIASHSSCRYFTPGWERNMSDDMIKTLAEKGGVIQINFGSNFLSRDSRASRDKVNHYLDQWAQTQDSLDERQVRDFRAEYFRENYSYSGVSDVVDHIDHVVELVGIDHVGFGSDFDGVGDTLPIGLKDVSQYPNILAELLRRGYSEEDIAKICYQNVFRVWNQTAEVASALNQAR
jgi:membrane dipeptidase